MQTFSQVVDSVKKASGRLWQTDLITQYVQHAIKDMHYNENSSLILYPDNLVETEITATLENGEQWARPAMWQKMQTVQYPYVRHASGLPIFPTYIRPGRRMAEYRQYYYQSGPYYIFAGYGGVGSVIRLAYYQRPGSLKYYAQAEAPAYYDGDTLVYQDLTASGGMNYTLEANQETARNLVSNWIIEGGEESVYWGALSTLYATVQNDGAAIAFSKFNKLRSSFIQTFGGIPVV